MRVFWLVLLKDITILFVLTADRGCDKLPDKGIHASSIRIARSGEKCNRFAHAWRIDERFD
jgi:hypothetical protein